MNEFLDRAEGILDSGLADNHVESFKLVFAAIAALKTVHSKATLDLNNVESVFAAFEMAKLFRTKVGDIKPENIQKLGAAMREVIARTLEARIQFPVTDDEVQATAEYRDFAQLIYRVVNSASHRAGIITFNYDLALDYALHHHTVPFGYCLDDAQPAGAVDLLKLHGSLNWTACVKCGGIIPYHLIDFFRKHRWDIGPRITRGDTTKFYFAHRLGDMSHCEMMASPSPWIVPPTWNKTQYHERINTVWRRAAQIIAQAENIFIIGYSFPETDIFFHYLYALGSVSETRLKRFWVFNPDGSRDLVSRFERLLGPDATGRFKFHPVVFGTAVDLIRQTLGIPTG